MVIGGSRGLAGAATGVGTAGRGAVATHVGTRCWGLAPAPAFRVPTNGRKPPRMELHHPGVAASPSSVQILQTSHLRRAEALGGIMITNRDLALIPADTPREAAEPDDRLIEAWDRFAAHLTDRSLDRVQRVILRLLSRATVAEPEMRRALLGEVAELDAALRAAREGLFPSTGPHDNAPPTAVGPADAFGAHRPPTNAAYIAARGRRVALTRRVARAAGQLAASENRMAEIYDRAAVRRPQEAPRLRANAERAREAARNGRRRSFSTRRSPNRVRELVGRR